MKNPKLFKSNQSRLYSETIQSRLYSELNGDNSSTNTSPDIKESIRFWKDIWASPTGHNRNVIRRMASLKVSGIFLKLPLMEPMDSGIRNWQNFMEGLLLNSTKTGKRQSIRMTNGRENCTNNERWSQGKSC